MGEKRKERKLMHRLRIAVPYSTEHRNEAFYLLLDGVDPFPSQSVAYFCGVGVVLDALTG